LESSTKNQARPEMWVSRDGRLRNKERCLLKGCEVLGKRLRGPLQS